MMIDSLYDIRSLRPVRACQLRQQPSQHLLVIHIIPGSPFKLRLIKLLDLTI